MEWFSIAVTVLVLVGTTVVWSLMNNPKNGTVVGCCHCGACIATGECVMVKNCRKKEEVILTNPSEKV